MLIAIITFLVGIIGVGLVSFGAWQIFPPAGLIVCGTLCLAWSYLMSKAAASRSVTPTEGDE
ncbi:hypothetical protein [Neptuniibacter sp.]|uniref:hypothetical protein n=1 Tax=Neptuniibacter sp. TaxID=1962643 RepID=UPI0026185E7C|nr:hypothetical protein [Neptuniibacter sp.]MCP4595750.1 DUF2244 domain-containing protein [Neptuniibacter sp.]